MVSQDTLQRHGGQSVNVSQEGKPSTFIQVKREPKRREGGQQLLPGDLSS